MSDLLSLVQFLPSAANFLEGIIVTFKRKQTGKSLWSHEYSNHTQFKTQVVANISQTLFFDTKQVSIKHFSNKTTIQLSVNLTTVHMLNNQGLQKPYYLIYKRYLQSPVINMKKPFTEPKIQV